MPDLEVTEVVLIHYNFVNNDYQQDSRVLYIFVPNKSYGQLLDISLKNFIFLKTFDSEFSYIEVWFTDQNSKPLQIEGKINVTLVIDLSVKHRKGWDIQFILEIEYFWKAMDFYHLPKIWVNIGKNISNNLSDKYSQKLLDHAIQSATDAFETASKRAIQETVEAGGDLIGNKIADKIRKV